MKSKKLTLITTTIVFVAFAMPLQLTAQHTQYTVTDLGTLGGMRSFAGGLNNKGLVEGSSRIAGNTAVHAFLWREGLMTDLGTLGGRDSVARFRPSERGEAGGYSETATLDPLGEDFCGFGTQLICLPFVWRHGLLTPLPTLGGNNGRGNGMNSRGQLAGLAENTTSDPTCIAPQVLQFKPVIGLQQHDGSRRIPCWVLLKSGQRVRVSTRKCWRS
jgi:probable HAF family extracellular repeat protein